MNTKKLVSFILVFSIMLSSLVFAQGGKEEKEMVLSWPTIWVGIDSKSAQIDRLVTEFNEMHKGKFKVETEGNPDADGYRTKLNTQIAARQVPDLFIFNPEPTSFSFYEDDNLLMDFTEELAGDWSKDFVEGAISSATISGKTKSIPYEIAVTPIWYNKALLGKAGVESFPRSIDEFWEVAELLKNAGIVPTSQMTGGTNAWTSMLWFSHLAASIGGPNVWNLPLTDSVFEEAAEILLKMYSDGNTTKDAVGGDAGVSGGHYMAGRTAMFINGPWYIGRVRDEVPEVYASTEIASVPAAGDYPGGQIGFPISNLSAAYTDNETQKEAVIAFMKWMTRPESVKAISLDSGSLFAIKYDMGSEEKVDQLQGKFMEAVGNASFVTSHFAANFPTDVVAEFGQALASMALGLSTPAEFLEQIYAVANK